jgi:hypothetical protein
MDKLPEGTFQAITFLSSAYMGYKHGLGAAISTMVVLSIFFIILSLYLFAKKHAVLVDGFEHNTRRRQGINALYDVADKTLLKMLGKN